LIRKLLASQDNETSMDRLKPSFPICDELDVLMHENKTTMNVITRPMMDWASKLGEMPPAASSNLPRMLLHESGS